MCDRQENQNVRKIALFRLSAHMIQTTYTPSQKPENKRLLLITHTYHFGHFLLPNKLSFVIAEFLQKIMMTMVDTVYTSPSQHPHISLHSSPLSLSFPHPTSQISLNHCTNTLLPLLNPYHPIHTSFLSFTLTITPSDPHPHSSPSPHPSPHPIPHRLHPHTPPTPLTPHTLT